VTEDAGHRHSLPRRAGPLNLRIDDQGRARQRELARADGGAGGLRARLETDSSVAIPCEASGDEADVGYIDPCLGGGDGRLPVLDQPSTPSGPGEGPLHDRAARQDLEPLRGIRLRHDLDRPRADPSTRRSFGPA